MAQNAESAAKDTSQPKVAAVECHAPQWLVISTYLVAQGIVAYYIYKNWHSPTNTVLAWLFLSFVITQITADFAKFTVPCFKSALIGLCSLIPALVAVFVL